MKKLNCLLAAAFGIASMAGTLSAQVISVQFDATTLNGSLSAGAVPETLWNHDTNSTAYVGSGTSFLNNLVDSTNTVTGISESTINNGTYNQYHTLSFANAGDQALFTRGYLGGFTDPMIFALDLTGLDPAANYSLLVYVVGTANIAEQLSASVGSTTYYFDTATDSTGAAPLTTYVRATSTDVSGTSVADYVQFDNLTGSTTQELTINPAGGQDFNVAGFQLVQQAVPEPATLGSILAGFGILLAGRRFRKVSR